MRTGKAGRGRHTGQPGIKGIDMVANFFRLALGGLCPLFGIGYMLVAH